MGRRLEDLIHFYRLIDRLAAGRAGGRRLGECHGRLDWPRRGVYFFFEPGERRSETGVGSRVVRVGTHALARTSQTTLWNRLAQHRGTKMGQGNHRGSIFRLLVGQALLARDDLDVPSWGVGSSLGAAARRFRTSRDSLAAREAPVENRVSSILGGMRLVVLEIEDEPGPTTLRGYIERNAIALLSNHGRAPIDAPSPDWLGGRSPRDRVRGSGLWNQEHVEGNHDDDIAR